MTSQTPPVDCASSRDGAAGFSLVELLVTMVVMLAVLGVVAQVVARTSVLRQQRDLDPPLHRRDRRDDRAAAAPGRDGQPDPDGNGLLDSVGIVSDWNPRDGVVDPYEDIEFSVAGNTLFKQEPADAAPVAFADDVTGLPSPTSTRPAAPCSTPSPRHRASSPSSQFTVQRRPSTGARHHAVVVRLDQETRMTAHPRHTDASTRAARSERGAALIFALFGLGRADHPRPRADQHGHDGHEDDHQRARHAAGARPRRRRPGARAEADHLPGVGLAQHDAVSSSAATPSPATATSSRRRPRWRCPPATRRCSSSRPPRAGSRSALAATASTSATTTSPTWTRTRTCSTSTRTPTSTSASSSGRSAPPATAPRRRSSRCSAGTGAGAARERPPVGPRRRRRQRVGRHHPRQRHDGHRRQQRLRRADASARRSRSPAAFPRAVPGATRTAKCVRLGADQHPPDLPHQLSVDGRLLADDRASAERPWAVPCGSTAR